MNVPNIKAWLHACLVVAVFVSGCNKGTESTDEPDEPDKATTGQVEGRVRDAENSASVRYVVVSVAGIQDTTDSIGKYRIPGILDGKHS